MISRQHFALGSVPIFALACSLFLSPSATHPGLALAQDASVPPMFVGQISDIDAYLGFSTDGTALAGYACDGAANTLADTFEGRASDAQNGVLALTTESGLPLSVNVDAASLQAAVASGGQITGSLTTPDGASHQFSLVPASGPGAVWEEDETLADGTPASGGWVVLNDGSIRGSRQKGSGAQTQTAGLSAGIPGVTPEVFAEVKAAQAAAEADASAIVPAVQQPVVLPTITVNVQEQGVAIMQTTLNIARVPPPPDY